MAPKRESKSPPRRRPAAPAPAPAPAAAAPTPSGTASEASEFRCPICVDILVDPVSLKCGHNLCLSCCTEYIERKKTDEMPALRTKCPTCTSWIPLKVPAVNTTLRDSIEAQYKDQVDMRRKELPSPEELKLRVAALRGDSISDRAVQGAQSQTGLLVCMAVVAVLSAIIGVVAGGATTSGPVDTGKSGTLGAFLSDSGLGWYAKPYAETDVSLFADVPLQSAADRVGISSQSDRRLLYTSLAARGLRPISDWDGADVAAWMDAVLPAGAVPASNLDGPSLLVANDEAAFVGVGLEPVHARRLFEELSDIKSAARSLYDWSLTNMYKAHWGIALLHQAPVLTAWRVRYGWWPPELIGDDSSPYARCVKEMPAAEFWLAATIFPHTCTIRTIDAEGHRIGPSWATRLVKAQLQIEHINTLVDALLLSSLRGSTPGQHLAKVTRNFMSDDVLATFTAASGYYFSAYFFYYLFYFVPWFISIFCYKYGTLWIAPMGFCAKTTLSCATKWALFETVKHRVLFLLVWTLICANYLMNKDFAAPFGGMIVVVAATTISCHGVAALSSIRG